ncbi:hypothetical protein PENTCL1PPCAC_9521, partial [Pristionchus entomophagus]
QILRRIKKTRSIADHFVDLHRFQCEFTSTFSSHGLYTNTVCYDCDCPTSASISAASQDGNSTREILDYRI